MTRITLDPDGDVCLRLPYHHHNIYIQTVAEAQDDNEASIDNPGPAESSTGLRSKTTVDLIVSSKVLATVSPVFKTMFYGNFREGVEAAAARASSRLYMQELPEDDDEVTLVFCALTHGKTEQLPEEPSIPFQLAMAEFAKKYLCIKFLELPGRAWLRRELEQEELSRMHVEVAYYSVARLCHLLYVAYTLDLPHEFAVIMGTIAINLHGRNDDLSDLMPERFDHNVMDFLKALRRDCAHRVHKEVLKQAAVYDIPVFREHKHVPNCEAVANARYTEATAILGIWPIRPEYIGTTLQAVFDNLPALSPGLMTAVLDEPVECTCATESGYCRVQLSKRAADLVSACSEMREDLLGRRAEFLSYYQCLDCLKAGGIADQNVAVDCRCAHMYPDEN